MISFGGVPASGSPVHVSAVASGDRLHVFAYYRGSNAERGVVYHRWGDGPGWTPSPLGWVMVLDDVDEPPVAVSWGQDRVDLISLHQSDTVIHSYSKDGGKSWLSEPVGTEFRATPVAACWGPLRLDMVGLQDVEPGHMAQGRFWGSFHKFSDNGQWNPPTGWPWTSLEGNLHQIELGMTAWRPNRLDVVARMEFTGEIVHRWTNDHGQWAQKDGQPIWEDLGSGGVGFDMAPVVCGRGRHLDVLAVDGQGSVRHRSSDGSRWKPSLTGSPRTDWTDLSKTDTGSWERLGGRASGPPSAVSWSARQPEDPGRLDVVVGTSNGRIGHRWLTVAPDGSDRWNSDWEDLLDPGITGMTDSPVLVSRGKERLDLLAVFDTEIMYSGFDTRGSSETWTRWQSLGSPINLPATGSQG